MEINKQYTKTKKQSLKKGDIMEIGKKYKIINNTYQEKNKYREFTATLIEEMEKFYLFKRNGGAKECILKIDFAIGDYTAREVF